MKSYIDRAGQIYGRLTVLRYAGKTRNRAAIWICRCSCGREKEFVVASLISGLTKSCGCLSREVASKIAERGSKTHGMSKSEEYRIWVDMIRRCRNAKRPEFRLYGARGIKVCKRWESFERFLEDVGKRPSKDHTLDRIDNDGDYSPENCRWGTSEQQANNKRATRRITLGDETLSIAQWERALGFKQNVLWSRLKNGWDIARAMTAPLGSTKTT